MIWIVWIVYNSKPVECVQRLSLLENVPDFMQFLFLRKYFRAVRFSEMIRFSANPLISADRELVALVVAPTGKSFSSIACISAESERCLQICGVEIIQVNYSFLIKNAKHSTTIIWLAG